MNKKEILDIIDSFNKPEILIKFFDNFGQHIKNFSLEEIDTVLKHYEVISKKRNGFLESEGFDKIIGSIVLEEQLEEVKELLKKDYPDYYMYLVEEKQVKEEMKDLSLIIKTVTDDNLLSYLQKSYINKDNLIEVMVNKDLPLEVFSSLSREFEDFLQEVKYTILDRVLKEVMNTNSKEIVSNSFIKIKKMSGILNLNDDKEKFYDCVNPFLYFFINKPPSLTNKDVFSIISFLFENVSFDNIELKDYFIDMIDKGYEFNNITKKKIDFNKFVFLQKVLIKKMDFCILNDYEKLLNKAGINKFKLFVHILSSNGISSEYLQKSYLKLIDKEFLKLKEKNKIIEENEFEIYKIIKYFKSTYRTEMENHLINSFSFDNLKSTYKPEDKWCGSYMLSGNAYSLSLLNKPGLYLFCEYFKKNKKTDKQNYFEETLVPNIKLKEWLSCIEFLKEKSPIFYNKNIEIQKLGAFKKNKELYIFKEHEEILKTVKSNNEEDLNIQKKRL